MSYYNFNTNNLLNKYPYKFNIILLCLLIIQFSIFIFSIFYKIIDTIDVKMYIACEENKCNYYFYGYSKQLKNIFSSNNIIIDNINYPYKIISASDMKVDSTTNENYQFIQIKADIPKTYQINNLYIDVKVKVKEETLLKKIISLIFERK